MDRNKLNQCLITFIVAGMSILLMCHALWGKNGAAYEHDVKAAIVFKLLQFIEWPSDVSADTEKRTITIGVLGTDAYNSINKIFKGKVVDGKKIEIHRLAKENILKKKAYDDGEKMQVGTLRDYAVVLICPEEGIDFAQLRPLLKGRGTLTIGEEKGFLEKGGMINFVMENEKVKFEINNCAAEEAGFHIRSSVLRMAKRVITKRVIKEKEE
ncbi:MAG: YfiR family protein [bacterium]